MCLTFSNVKFNWRSLSSHSIPALPCLHPHWSLSHSWNNFLSLVLQASLFHISIMCFSVSVKSMGHFSVHCQNGPQVIIRSPPQVHISCFQVLANMNKSSGFCVDNFLFFFGQIPRGMTVGCCCESMFSSARNHQAVIQHGFDTLHSHQQWLWEYELFATPCTHVLS